MKEFKSGNYINQGYYKSFQPNLINKDWQVEDMQLLNLLSKADRFLGRLDMYSEYVNIDLYLRMHITKEATQSSKIEGTQTNMEEAFLDKEDIAFQINLIVENQRETEQMTFDYFKEVNSLCTPEQRLKLQKLIQRVFNRAGGPPPPNKD